MSYHSSLNENRRIANGYLKNNYVKARRRYNFFPKCVATIIVLALVSIPTDLFFLIKGAMAPNGFWENFAVWVLGLAVFGGPQIWFIVVGLACIFKAIWGD